MSGHSSSSEGAGVIVGLVIVLAVGGYTMSLGVGAWGPTRTWEVTVNRLYVDYSGSDENRQSHYMVGTDQGVFECDNGWLLGVWNADELYSRLVAGRRYRITTEGNRVVGIFFQEYPYITSVQPLAERESGHGQAQE